MWRLNPLPLLDLGGIRSLVVCGIETSCHGDGAEGRFGLMAVGVAGVSGGIGLFWGWRRMA